MKYIKQLPNVSTITKKYKLEKCYISKRIQNIDVIKNILTGKDSRKLLLIGPCSADREDAVIEYVSRLAKLQEEVDEKFFMIPRVYTGKPRSNGIGYKGLIHRPHFNSKKDDIVSGIEAVRKLHINVIRETGLFAVDELLYPDLYRYIEDLLVYTAIGARSVENQQHRLLASGVEIPVGMKNPTSGNFLVMLNSIIAAQSKQHYVFNGWEVETDGNPYTHAILRGYTDFYGNNIANYYYESICKLHDLYYKQNLKFPAVIIDCNHSNSNKRYMEQIRIAEEVANYCKRNKDIDKFVKGFMIESYLEDGKQMLGENIYGCSVTDPCLGWEKTEHFVLELADKL